MATLNVSLPDPMKDWIAAQIAGGRYASSSDYIRDLIRRDQEYRENQQALQEAITKGLESGISERSVSQIVAEAKRKLKAAK
jgi:antitoxin ParD1/3/4